jgi:3'-phosphoadenosine 5'-phosphosulfate sulfotransferase (PAPS reductase)/FAD synthetase
MNMIKLPAEGAGLQVVASVSGGKDSTALILALRDAEIPARYVFADTGWEADETYGYLDLLRERLGITIDVVGVPGGMMARARYLAGFPGRMQRWCTRELKIEPLREHHDRIIEETGIETVSAMGVRADESAARAKMPEWEDEPTGPRSWGGFVWRPLITWSVADVIGIHVRHGVPMNPLYHEGFDRVGCFPCIFENKEGLRRMAELRPGRIAELRAAEAEITEMRRQRNEDKPGRYSHTDASFFQTARQGFSGIDKVIEWARTDHGGKQYPLFSPAPSGGCMRWGLCETPPPSVEDDDTEAA